MDIRLLLAFLGCFCLSNGYKILMIGTFNGKSHALFLQHFVRALLDKQHEVTFLTSHSMSHLELTNYTEVLVDPPFDIFKIFPQDTLLTFSEQSPFTTIAQMAVFTEVMNDHVYQNPNVQKLIHSTEKHFDLVINEEFFADSFLMFGYKFKAPIITICPFGITNYIDEQMGLLTPVSIAPHWMLPYSDNMTFYERLYNTALIIYDWYYQQRYYLPVEESLARKYFSHLAPLPSIKDLRNSVSVAFVNKHRAISPPRPTMPGIVDVGGCHLKEGKPLPSDLQTFLDESKDGIIYVSFGTILQSSRFPKEKIVSLFNAFKSLKQRVLWKFEDESFANIPSNVMVRKWMPQNDILAHPKLVLFISHGGLFGTTESLYHGVPLLLIPFFGDQHRNAHRISLAGYGEFLEFGDVTKDILLKKITDIISDKKYLDRAQQTSAVFKDNLVHPMDEAVFWIEHVCKFKGAKHLKSHAVNMSRFSYLLLDVLLVNVLAVLTITYVLCVIVKKIFLKKESAVVSKKKLK